MEKAVCVLLVCGDKLLSISRKNDSTAIGLPGGKVDEGDESLEAAARRELFEETGLIANELIAVFTQVCGPGRDGRSFETTTFSAKSYSGILEQKEKGVVGWFNPDKFITSSPFSAYNKELFDVLNIKY